MTKYEIELRELVEFVPELANSEEYLCSKFLKGLLMISKLNILINPYTKNNKLLGILEARVESSGIGF